jgi:tetratricopeptide (TPR) repeat protein
MPLMAKRRAVAHYNAGTRMLLSRPTSQKDLEKTIKHFQQATKLDPSFAEAFHNLAHTWYTVAEVCRFFTSSSAFWLNVYGGRFGRKGGLEDRTDVENYMTIVLESGLNAVDQALAIRYDFPQAHNTRAMILAKLLRLDEALKATVVALAQTPDYKNASENQERIKEGIRRRASLGYFDDGTFLEHLKEQARTQSQIWKDLMK